MIETKEGMKSLLEVTKNDYIVPKGEELLVHYTAEKVLIDSKTGKRLSHPDLIKTDVKMFETIIKRNLELQDYSVNILFHPEGKYVEFTPVMDAGTENEILRRKLAELQSKVDAMKSPKEEEGEAESPKNKGGRPKKVSE